MPDPTVFKEFDAEVLIEETKARAVPPEEALMVTQAKEFLVTDAASHAEAQQIILRLERLRRTIEATWKAPKEMAHKAHRAVCRGEDEQLGPILAARHALTPKILDYEREQRRLEEAERARLEAEERKRQDELALQDAVDAEQQGHAELAAALLEEQQLAPAPAVVVPSARAQVKGVGSTTTWTAEVVDLHALLEWLATQQDPGDAIEVRKSWLNAQARAMKNNLRIPGLRPVKDDGLRVRPGR